MVLKLEDAKKKIIEYLEEKGHWHKQRLITSLRDWVFSRQRYWGEPIPIVYCDEVRICSACLKSELPLKLPEVESYDAYR